MTKPVTEQDLLSYISSQIPSNQLPDEYGVRQLSVILGISRDKVQNILTDLESKNLVTFRYARNPVSGHVLKVYKVQLEVLQCLQETECGYGSSRKPRAGK